MFVKLAIFLCFVTATLAAWNGPLAGGAPADRYPAGISKEACPNFPECENPAVALTAGIVASNPGYLASSAPQQYEAPSASQWNGASNGQYNAPSASNAQYNAPSSSQWNPDSQYNSRQWDGAQNNGQWNAAQNNGQWNQQAGFHSAPEYSPDSSYAPAPSGLVGQTAQVPAGVDPASCSNYPYCS